MTEVNEIQVALEEIKSTVEAKFEGTALAADVEKSIEKAVEGKVSQEEVEALKGELEALEAKFDSIPSLNLISKKEEQNMNTIHEVFTKSLETKGRAEAEILVKNITASANNIGAPVDTYGLTGSAFASNPVRMLASTIDTVSKAVTLPVRTGSHGAATANTSNKSLTASGNSAVSEVTILVETIEALTEVTLEAAEDIVGFDQFWSQDMIDEVASKEAAAHATVIEGMAGVETAANTAVDLEDMAKLFYSVGQHYRTNGAFVVSTDVMEALRTINTSSTGGSFAYDPKFEIFRLYGRPIFENSYMADVAAGNVVAAFGDWKKGMAIANRSAATVNRYEQTKPGYYTYHASLRSGAAQWHASALKTLTVKT